MTVRAALPLLLCGCTFAISGLDVTIDVPDLQVADLTVVDAREVDATDAATLCDPKGSMDTCSTDQRSLLRCRADGSGYDSESCGLGCGTPAHCLRLEPTGVAQASDYATASAIPTITSNVLFNTDDGSITGGLTRSAGTGLKNGIFFRQATQVGSAVKVGIFGFAGFNVAAGVVIRAQGASALSLVSSGDVTLSGTFNLQDDCAGPARAAGSAPGVGGGAVGGAASGGKSSGGGGGGHGDVGGSGGASTIAGGAGGALFGDLLMEPVGLLGGGGGGAGGAGGLGGSGGGAIQVAVNGRLTIGGTIHAGGCGGSPGGPNGSGGGGGAGGAILIEAVTLVLEKGSIVAANGGGGGGAGAGSGAGANGAATANPAGGGAGASAGGAGGAIGKTAGQSAPAGNKLSGGGGGGVGMIALKTLDGTVDDQGAVFSPDRSLTRAGF